MRPPTIGHLPSEDTPAGAPVTALSAINAPCGAGLHGSLPAAPASNVSNTTVLLAKIAPGLTTTRSPELVCVAPAAPQAPPVAVHKLTNHPPPFGCPTAGMELVGVADAVLQVSPALPVTQRSVAPALGSGDPSSSVAPAGIVVSCRYCGVKSPWLKYPGTG